MSSNIVSIRGAITANNDEQSIAKASELLMRRIFFKNGLTNADVVNTMISTTADLTAFYPARALREVGYSMPLFSCLEPNIDGALGHCIRFLVTARSDNPVSNVYIGAARALRKDLTDYYAIALDGPSGAGKTTVAKLVAKELGITYLDTGALYRALGLKVLSEKLPTTDEAKVKACIEHVNVSIEYADGVQKVLLDGEDVSASIRTPEVSMAASNVSALPYVRAKLLSIQREIAHASSVILDGRDIGTVVLPDAEFKFFLTASPEIRARRRFDELKAKGQNVIYEDVLADVNARDRNDSGRKIAPLKMSYDAVKIDSDEMSAHDVAMSIINDVKEVVQ